MTMNTIQTPAAVIENIDSRLTLLSHTLQRTQPIHVTEELLMGLTRAIQDIQKEVVPLIQFCEEMVDEYMASKAEQ